MATTTTKTIEEDIQALRTDVAALTESIANMLSGASDARKAARNGVDAGLHDAASAGRDFMSDASRLGRDSAYAAEETASNLVSGLAGEIKRNPFMAMAAALFTGFVVGSVRHR